MQADGAEVTDTATEKRKLNAAQCKRTKMVTYV